MMDDDIDVQTLLIKFSDGSEVRLQEWFTNQFEYFKSIINELGEDRWDSDKGKEYKFLVIELDENSETGLSRMLSKSKLSFLRRFAYHLHFMKEDDSESTGGTDGVDNEWTPPDTFQVKTITKFIIDDNWEELFEIFALSDYLGNRQICYAITDQVITYFSANNFMNVEKLEEIFKVTSELSKDQQETILNKFDWRN